MGRIAAQQELIGKPGLPTPQGEVRSLAGSCRAPRLRAGEPAQASGCPELLWSTSDGRPAWAEGATELARQWEPSYLAAKCGRSADRPAC